MPENLFRIGNRIDQYRITGYLARGLTTETYLAFDEDANAQVALKCRDPRRSRKASLSESESESEAKFRAKLDGLVGLSGTCIPTVRAGGVTGGIQWLVTDAI